MANVIEEKWNDILNYLKEEHELTNVSYDTWLVPLKIVSFENSVLTLLYPGDENGAEYINKKYSLFLQVAIEEITGIHCDIRFTTTEAPKKQPVKTVTPAHYSNLNPRYTFDTFVVGNNNKLAHAASLAVAESPGKFYNPLFIYGGAGLGKTHLMQSIAHFILKNDPYAKVMYVTSENFTNELIHSIRNQKNQDFHNKYRNVDVLLIDDIQFIINKESTQQEVFHTFNTLFEANKAIVLSSDRPPKDLETLEERLSSRFGSGLTVDIGLPDFETRMAILRKKEEMEGYNIDNEVIQYIATNIVSNIRNLEGALTTVTAMSKLEKKEINLDLAKKVLKDRINPNAKREITPEYILEVVAEHYHLKTSDLISKGRKREIAGPRQISMYLIREMTTTSLQKIAELLQKRDHTTIIYGIEKIMKDMETDENLKNNVDILKKKINPS